MVSSHEISRRAHMCCETEQQVPRNPRERLCGIKSYKEITEKNNKARLFKLFGTDTCILLFILPTFFCNIYEYFPQGHGVFFCLHQG